LDHISTGMILFLCLSGFVSAFIDSTVGGGGLVSLPALLFTGLPPALALGTNKLAGTMSSLTSTLSYLRSGKIDWKLVRYLLPLSLIGSVVGACLVRFLPSSFLRPMVVVLLIAVTLYTIFKRDLGKRSTYSGLRKKAVWVTSLVALLIGFYDGFFGPGTGSFLIISFLLIGFDFVQASGNAKALNFASNVGGLGTFLFLHAVNYEYGLIMGLSMAVGAISGSQVAIRKGVTYVRPIFITVTLIMIGKQVLDFL
jgi:uncharacterized protein